MPQVITNPARNASRQIIVLNAPDTEAWVRDQLIPRLRAANPEIEILTEAQLKEQRMAGLPWMVNIENEVGRADKVLFVLSPELLPQQTMEYFFQLAYFGQKVVTAMVLKCTPPGRLAMLDSADMTLVSGTSLDQNWERLIEALV